MLKGDVKYRFVIDIATMAACREPQMKISRSGATPWTAGPADWFTGTVRIDPLFATETPGRVAGAHVSFEPGVRTA